MCNCSAVLAAVVWWLALLQSAKIAAMLEPAVLCCVQETLSRQREHEECTSEGRCGRGLHLQSNVAIDLIQLINEFIDLLNHKMLALPDRPPLVFSAGLCLRARFCFRAEGYGRAGAG